MSCHVRVPTSTYIHRKNPNKIGLGFMYIQLYNAVGGESLQWWNRPALETPHLDGVLCHILEILLAIGGVERIECESVASVGDPLRLSSCGAILIRDFFCTKSNVMSTGQRFVRTTPGTSNSTSSYLPRCVFGDGRIIIEGVFVGRVSSPS
jgi:hypothetical protein